jgi:pimeloyl-ACP methyl ester carboxylesterase
VKTVALFWSGITALVFWGAPALTHAEASAGSSTGLRTDVIFSDYSPLTRGDELLRRYLTPLKMDDLASRAVRAGARYDGQMLDLTKERFALYVPTQPPPPNGYTLMVFVPPWESAVVPAEWIPVLEKQGVIFVTPAHSGNSVDILTRRYPLALAGAYNIMQHYQVDPDRVYIGGMSGGSRTALRLALLYPDLFRGAFLNASSDPIGTLQAPLPTPELFHRFQESSRLVFFTGEGDWMNVDKDYISRKSLHQWCVFDNYQQTIPFIGHDVATAAAFEEALLELQVHVPANPALLTQCREHYEHEMLDELQKVRTLLSQGKKRSAQALLKEIDEHYASLAAPASVELAGQIAGAP